MEQKNPLQPSSSLHLLENLILTRGFTNQKLKQKPFPFSMLSTREKGAVRESDRLKRKNTTGYPLSWTIKVMRILNSIYFFPLYAALTDHFATHLNPETAKKSRWGQRWHNHWTYYIQRNCRVYMEALEGAEKGLHLST